MSSVENEARFNKRSVVDILILIHLHDAAHGAFLFESIEISTAFFAHRVTEPFGIGLLLWPIIGLLLAFPRRAVFKWLILVCLFMNYTGILYWALSTDTEAPLEALQRTLRSVPVVFLLIFGAYVFGNAYVLRAWSKSRDEL